MKAIKNLLLILSTGYIFVYFSEHLFWARMRPDDSLSGWLGAWLVYSLLAFIFLDLLARFRVNNRWTLFLVGAAFGWLAEGLVVQTAYEMLPLSLSFTGLAWHALISVWIGWFAVQRTLLSGRRLDTLGLAALTGLAYGLWAISWWLEPEGGVASLRAFASFSFTATLLVMLAYTVANWSSTAPFAPHRRVRIVIYGLFGLVFVFVTVPAAPLALAILPLLLGLVLWGLRRSQGQAAEGCILDHLQGQIPLHKLLSLLALPATAVAFYAAAQALNLAWRTNWLLYLVATPLGFLLFGLSLFYTRPRRPALAGAAAQSIPPGSRQDSPQPGR